MKKYISVIIALALLGSCRSRTEGEDKKEKNVSTRAYSINRHNSYSDLFLDSLGMEKFIVAKKLPDSMARRMRSFYNTRNYQFAWFTSEGLTEQARGFWNLHDYVTTYDTSSFLKDKTLQKRMNNLMMEESLSVNANNKTFVDTELTLTVHFISLMLGHYEKGYVKRKEMERFIPFKRVDAIYLADSLINKKHKDDKYFEDVNANYAALKQQLVHYVNIAKQGNWPQITSNPKTLKQGSRGPDIAAIKRLLHLTGDLPVADTSQAFNDTLELAVKSFEERHGYKPDGVIDAALVKEMNVPPVRRVQQILMNMDRMRWLAPEPKGNLIVVNIPEFVLHVYEGKQKVFEIDVVVGKQGHNTMMFNGDLNQVVFSPYWNVPPSIVRNEILPAMERNPGYLAGQNMEITGDEDGLPAIRQRPGPGNALGRVKFLFPNSFNIYLHDTPAKSLFEKDKRAFSHGCIRVREPEKLAMYVLRNQPEWTPEKINAAMNRGVEQAVRVKQPIPVVITYYTAWVDDRGRLNFREDIYGHDEHLRRKMFTS
ncbi:MAG TPA: L,D-transpeptidase family protein [Chitinophagaceae bacterium]|nr:L,D-transpeptidase family protein [Chitinophagaceae bacterium]